MKPIYTLLLFGIFFYNQLHAIDYVAISEVLFDTPLNEDQSESPHNFGEFIEIYNAGENIVSLEGWKLQTFDPAQTFEFPNIQLNAKSFLIVAFSDFNLDDDSYSEFYYYFGDPDPVEIIFQEELILPNDTCKLVLKDKNNITRDSLYATSNNVNWPPEDCSGGSYCDFRSLQRSFIDFNYDGTTKYSYSWYLSDGSFDPKAPAPITVGYSSWTITTNILPITAPDINNYVVEITPLIEINDIASLNWENGIENALVNITYYDALGREKQKTQLNYTPDNKHLTTFTEYDAFNRITKQWLPTITEKGQFTSNNFINNANSFYSNNNPYKEYIYSSESINDNEVYKNSLVGIQEPGKDLNGKYKKINHRANNDDEVKYFYVNSSNALVCSGYYNAKTLIYEEIKDEDNLTIATYKDRQNRIVLQRKAGNVDTYFVYNDLGQLSYVIPPILADQLGDGVYTTSHEAIKDYAYLYLYDNRGNNILKKLPGADPIFMLYDKANRLIAQQSGNQRTNNLYTAHKYDKWGRLVYTTENVLPNQNSLLNYQQRAAQEYVIEECFTEYAENYGLKTTEYSRTLDETLELNNILRVIYYDSYDFLSSSSELNYNANLNINTLPKANNVKGRITGEQIYLLDSDNTYITKTYYYDQRGNIIQQHSSNHVNGVNNQYIAYNFSGNITRKRMIHKANNVPVVEDYIYSYDHANRLTQTMYVYNNRNNILLNKFVYDNLGRVKKKYIMNQMDSIAYTYNIRNQITSIHSKNFSEQIYYTTTDPLQASPIPRFNGNVSAINYSFGNNITNGYTYYYDNQNRLSSNYSLLNQQFGDYAYSESFQYDKNGNITHLSRWDNQDTMDHLYLEYDGNQVIGVSDEGFPPYSYDSKQYYDYADSDIEFGYDANGNMTYDLDRNICAIKYNLLNLPDTIQFSNGNLIVHRYDALGNKCFTTYYTRNTPIVVPIGNIVEQLDSAYNVLTYSYNDHFVYKINANNILKREFVHNPEGYIRYGNDGVNFYPYYYIKDYLGNVRETYVCLTQTSSQCIQRMQYYPSGMPWNDNYQASQQPYKYGSKEFVEMHGLDEYDSEARWYYPALMRTTTQDPLAAKYYDISPYAWCANNPVNLVDPDGREWLDYLGNKILDHDNIKVYIFYNSKDFESQTMKMYSDKEKIYGIGSVALSSVTTESEFIEDWKNMKSGYIKEVNINHHGNNQTLILNHMKSQYITATGDGSTTRDTETDVKDNTNVQDLPYPKGNILEAQLNLHTCKSNSKTQNPLKGSGLTLLEAFRYTFDFKVVKGTSAGVSYNRFTKEPEPQWFWQKWDYLKRSK